MSLEPFDPQAKAGPPPRGKEPRPPPRPPPALAVWVAIGFGSGLLRPGPGTWGSLAALGLGAGLWSWGGPVALYTAALAASLIGVWAAARYEHLTGRHDAPEVVVDEFAGQWLALAALPLAGAALSPQGVAAAFVLFRLFDIWKPGPIGWADRRLSGGLGVMADDVLAGLLTGAILWALTVYGGLEAHVSG
ncbi:MAG: phosphatidylglycerophosphatase A [Marivibrio sp.]|uniref:phosphatidylglycerophosphatase A family protein n=1 Tax=Marivibrio sp. TaxID=2039719 RepID=UPI0032EFB716